MKLQFNILWFDDNTELFDSLDLGYLKSEISDWGFIPNIKLVTTPKEFTAETPYADYDLLVVDFNIDGHGDGKDFIADVRKHEVFTEVIFYSSSATALLWEAVSASRLEGVYVASKNNIQERILQVGHHTVRKVLDVENMRGIVMAEVADLDLLLDGILLSAIGGLDANVQKKIFDKFHKASVELHAAQKGNLDLFSESPTVEMLLSLCDSDKRWANYNRAAKHHESLKKTGLGYYVDEILKPRNFLAHGVPERRADGTYMFRHQNREYGFSDSVGAALRKEIIKYRTIFDEIQKELAAAK